MRLFDLVVEKNLETGSLHGEVHLDEAAMAPILIYPNAIIGLSDGGAHVQFQSGFGFSTPLLAEFDPDTVRHCRSKSCTTSRPAPSTSRSRPRASPRPSSMARW